MSPKTIKKASRQVLTLNKWAALKKRKVDPHFAGRAHLIPEIASYIAQCVATNVQPQLFVTAWNGKDKNQLALGFAVPYDYEQQLNIPNESSLEDLFGCQD